MFMSVRMAWIRFDRCTCTPGVRPAGCFRFVVRLPVGGYSRRVVVFLHVTTVAPRTHTPRAAPATAGRHGTPPTGPPAASAHPGHSPHGPQRRALPRSRVGRETQRPKAGRLPPCWAEFPRSTRPAAEIAVGDARFAPAHGGGCYPCRCHSSVSGQFSSN